MSFIYWREQFPDSDWNLPEDSQSDDWIKFGKGLFETVTIGGVDVEVFKEKELPRIMKETKMGQDLTIDESHVMDVLESARTLVRIGIPPIAFFDGLRLYKGVHSGGSIHSALILDVKEDTVRITDPSYLGGLGYQTFEHEALADAMASLPPVVQYVSPKNGIRVGGYDEEASLHKWIPEEESEGG